MQRPLYITTSIPYVNAEPHVGFALELVQADVIARYARLIGRSVRFQTGTDENALKNVLAAERAGVPTQTFVDRNAERFRALLVALSISADDFIRTTEVRHRAGVHAFWAALPPSDVYLQNYTGLYCPGCEDFYRPRDLDNGKCAEHRTSPVAVTEQNYFFRLSDYAEAIEQRLDAGHLEVVPNTRLREVLSFVRGGLLDFSISRDAGRTKGWGTSVPGDEGQCVYVWVDALINYLSAIGYGGEGDWRHWWSADVEKVHVIGKNVWKFHAVYWPALLASAGLPLPDKLLVHGFVTVDGQKIGKSLGNTVDPFALIERFGVDAVRYYLLRAIPTFGDGDFSVDRLGELYTADLANGLGNLVSRLATLGAKAEYVSQPPARPVGPPEGYATAIERYELDRAIAILWDGIRAVNQSIEQHRPWERDGPVLQDLIGKWLQTVWSIAYWLEPFLPDTTRRVKQVLFTGALQKPTPLFPRLS